MFDILRRCNYTALLFKCAYLRRIYFLFFDIACVYNHAPETNLYIFDTSLSTLCPCLAANEVSLRTFMFSVYAFSH